MQVLSKAAREQGASSYTIVSRLKWLEDLDIGLAGPHQVTNASLALYIVQAALSSPNCPQAFQQAAAELQDPRFRRPMIVQPPQPIPWYARTNFYGLFLVARNPKLALNMAVLLCIAVYYATQHLLRAYDESGWHGIGNIAPLYISASLLASFVSWDKYQDSRNKRPYRGHEAGQMQDRDDDEPLPSIELSPAMRCGRIYRALAATRWPGRAEVLKDPQSSAVLYLDVSSDFFKVRNYLTPSVSSARTLPKAASWQVVGLLPLLGARQAWLPHQSLLHPVHQATCLSPPLQPDPSGRKS